MVRNSVPLHKNAFTMIELIFAIVIIAISVISLPMITQVTSSSIEKNLVQEAIFATVAEINIATTYVWDENSLIDDNLTGALASDLSRIINIPAGDCNQTAGEFDTDGITPILRKMGSISRRCVNDASVGLYTSTDHNDSLEASMHTFTPIFTGGTSAVGYKKSYDSNLTVRNCGVAGCQQFGATAINLGLKEIEVIIREANDNTNTVVTRLRAYAANIGEVANHRRGL